MRPPRILDSSAFRLALLYISLFGISVIVLLGFIYWTTAGFMERQVVETINAEILGLAEQYKHQGLSGLVDVINDRAAQNPNRASLYLLADENYQPIAGNLNTWPITEQENETWVRFSLNGEKRTALARLFVLVGNYRLLVGRDVSEMNTIQEVIIDSLAWGLAITIVLGLVGGLLMSRSLLKRIDIINKTSRQIMGGDFSQRMPLRGTNDEFDQLGRNLNEMLDQMEKLMNGIRQVSDNIAHDLRNPLNRIRSRLEVSLLSDTDAESYRQVMEKTIAEADNLLKTFNALLTIAQAESGSVREDVVDLELGNLVRDGAELYEPLIEEKGQELDVDTSGGLTVKGNRHLLAQALSNLLDNAIKYTPGGGKISLITRNTPAGPELIVADTGPGVPPQARSKVLQRFYRLEHSRHTPGSGLGLSLVAAVAKLHQADLLLESNKPGLKVILRFPRKKQEKTRKNS